jgi:hypothetical protein
MNWMRKKLLLFAAITILTLSFSVVAAAVSSTQRIHVDGTYNQPRPSMFTLWFTNGTILSNHLTGFDIPVDNNKNPAKWTFDFSVSNNIASAINVSAAITSINVPQNIAANLTCNPTSGQSAIIQPDNRATFQVSGNFYTTSNYSEGEKFSYYFDVTVTSASTANGSTYQQSFTVYGDAKYPAATPTPTATPPPTATPNPTNPTPTGSASPTASPTNAIPEFSAVSVLAILLLLPVIAYSLKKMGKVGNLKPIAALAVIALLCTVFVGVSSAQTPTPSPTPAPNVKFSLWFYNGTAFPATINAGTFVYGNVQLNIGGIVMSPYAYGSQFMPEVNMIVLRNDGNVPITVSVALENKNAPPNIEIGLQFVPLNLGYAPPGSIWMGYDNLATGATVQPGQCKWLGLVLTLEQTNNVPSGTPTFTFNFSFDIAVTATQA